MHLIRKVKHTMPSGHLAVTLVLAEATDRLPSLSSERKGRTHITESQNGRGWKGPLWVI